MSSRSNRNDNHGEDWPSQRFRDHVITRLEYDFGIEAETVEKEIFAQTETKDDYMRASARAINGKNSRQNYANEMHYSSAPINNPVAANTNAEETVAWYKQKNFTFFDMAILALIIILLTLAVLQVIKS